MNIEIKGPNALLILAVIGVLFIVIAVGISQGVAGFFAAFGIGLCVIAAIVGASLYG